MLQSKTPQGLIGTGSGKGAYAHLRNPKETGCLQIIVPSTRIQAFCPMHKHSFQVSTTSHRLDQWHIYYITMLLQISPCGSCCQAQLIVLVGDPRRYAFPTYVYGTCSRYSVNITARGRASFRYPHMYSVGSLATLPRAWYNVGCRDRAFP